jgi:hypothetical protein
LLQAVATVYDSWGLRATSQVVLLPRKTTIIVNSIPSGIAIFIDGLSRRTPIVFDSMIGFQHYLRVLPTLNLEGSLFEFQRWTSNHHTEETPFTSYTIVEGENNLVVEYKSRRATCDTLGWKTTPVFDVEVCAASEVGGACASKSDHETATLYCQQAGGRLCTVIELRHDVAFDTGCNLDRKREYKNTAFQRFECCCLTSKEMYLFRVLILELHLRPCIIWVWGMHILNII